MSHVGKVLFFGRVSRYFRLLYLPPEINTKKAGLCQQEILTELLDGAQGLRYGDMHMAEY